MSIDALFGAIYVIHMPSLTDRRETFERSFEDIGCDRYEVVDAVDGSELDLYQLKAGGRLVRCDDQDRDLLPGEVGCFLSHAAIWQRMIDDGTDRVLVCEDDISFTEDANEVFRAAMAEVPADWDILYFHSHVPIGSDHKHRTPVSRHILVGDNEANSTLCYAITSRCARYFLEIGFPICNPVDGVTNWPSGDWCEDYHGYICNPYPCLPSGAESIIGDKFQRRASRHQLPGSAG